MNTPFTEHPCLPAPTVEDVRAIVARHGARAAEVLRGIEAKRLEAIAAAAADPFNHGWELECWKDADRLLALPETRLLANLGGGGSSKTTWMVKRGVQTAFTVRNARVLFLHEDEDASRDVHQAMAYDFLPPTLKPVDGWKPKKTTSTNIVYDSKIGFSGNAFTTPVGGKVRFGFYRQDIKRWEGSGWTLICCDENAPLKWIETLLFRLGRAGGKMIWCFTAIEGLTPAVAEMTRGARTLEWRPVDLDLLPADHQCHDTQDWPRGTMPYVQQGLRPEVKIVYFHSIMNPLSGYDPSQGRMAFYGYNDQKLFCQNKPKEIAERRAYGYARKSNRTVFPMFGAVHIMDDGRMRKLLNGEPGADGQEGRPTLEATRYQIIDPAGSRNFFMIWFAVDENGRHYIYREWPDVPTYGQWARPSDDPRKWDGDAGPAQTKVISGVVAYKRVILDAEGSEVIFDRFVDPRSGSTEAMAADAGESSVIDRFREEQKDERGTITGPMMLLTPAFSGKTEDDGLTQIDELLAWNPREPLTALVNEPHLYVSSACENVIWALSNYTAHDGAKAACKDPVDCVRYMALKKCSYVRASALQGIAGGGW